MNKPALPLSDCHDLGTHFASHGWTEEQIVDWLLENGYSTQGMTASRIQRAYFEQTQRG